MRSPARFPLALSLVLAACGDSGADGGDSDAATGETDAGAPFEPVTVTVPAVANPWLAGHPDGTPAAGGDVAPDQSPLLALAIDRPLALTFAVTGGVHFEPGCPPACGPIDGLEPVDHPQENGLGPCAAPADALVGVFLTDAAPDPAAELERLDFLSEGTRDFASLSPALAQVFFIGDGQTAEGFAQRFVAPAGATRLFLGVVDGTGWFNNSGAFEVTIDRAAD